jgi:hypothetical protein
VVEQPVELPADIHQQLRFISQVDGTSVARLISTMISNGIRQRKATDYTVRQHIHQMEGNSAYR